ncbi:hypothetical protein FQA39_LY19326 [Lamprigera yunnana]|nr:hypothetical protein FQA39_LY19326 [Lamprigera yunnana]
MKLVLLVIAVVCDLGDLALTPPTKQRDNVRWCMERIIEVYGDGATTVLSMYGDETKGNFLPYQMQIPVININMDKKVHKLNYQPLKELVIIDLVNLKNDITNQMAIWNDVDYLKRKYVFIWPFDAYNQEKEAFRVLWQFDILDAVVLVYDYRLRSDFTEVIVSNRLHPLNRCGGVVRNMSRFSCDLIKKERKQKFFRNYSKCNVTYLYDTLFQYVRNELNYITEFVLSEIATTLNLTFSKKLSTTTVTESDHYVLSLTEIRSCVFKSMFCGKIFISDFNVWTIPSPRRLRSLEVFQLIFKWNTWILILLSFIITSVLWWAISTCRHSTNFFSSVLDVYSITLRGAINTVPKCFSLRCLFLTYVIYSIHVQTGFTCNLVQLLTFPQYSVIKTLEELADSNLPLLMPSDGAYFILNMTHEGNQIFKKIKKNIVGVPDKEWQFFHNNLQILENSSILTSVTNIQVAVNQLQRRIYFIPDDTFSTSETFTFNTRRGCYVREDVDKVINGLTESGIIDYQKIFISDFNVWTIPSPRRLRSLEVFQLIFKWNTWILILLSFIITSVLWWAISTCRHSTNFFSSVLDVYSITLRGAINTVPKCFSLRCLFLTYVIYSIHVQTGFTCNLVQLLTFPQYSVIKTLEELADSNLPLLMPSDGAYFILNMTHEGNQIFKKIKKNIVGVPDKEWQFFHNNLQILENSSILTSVTNIQVAVNQLQRRIYFIPDDTFSTSETFTFNTRRGCYNLAL